MYQGPAWFLGRTANGRTAHVCSRGFECLIMKRYYCGSKIVRSFFVKYSPFNGFKYTTFSRITSIINELLLFLITPFWLYYVGKGIYEIYENWANTNFNDSTGCVQFLSMSVCYGNAQPPRFVVLDTKSILYLSKN